MKRFETVKIDKTTILEKEGIEINCYIAGVNSGAYSLPFVISVKTWARKWIFKKYFHKEIKLSITDCRNLRNELNNVIEFHENNK